MGLLFREHPKAQPEGGFRRSPGSNMRPLVYKASDLTTAPRRLLTTFTPLIELFGIYEMFKMLNQLVYLIHVKFYCYMVLKQIRH